MPAETLDFGENTFDPVACFTALPYLDQPMAMREIARVVRPTGRLVVGTAGVGYYTKHIVEGLGHEQPEAIRYGLDPILVAGARALDRNSVAPTSLRSWSPRAVGRLLGSYGFAVNRLMSDVDAVDPSWPSSYLGRPVYSATFAPHEADRWTVWGLVGGDGRAAAGRKLEAGGGSCGGPRWDSRHARK